MVTPWADRQLRSRVYAPSNAFRSRDIFASWSVMDSPGEMASGVIAGMQSLRGTFFKPNIVFLDLSAAEDREEEYGRILTEAAEEEIGVLVHVPHPRTGIGERVMVVTEPFQDYLPQAPGADVSIFGLGETMDFAFMRRMVEETRSTCLFARDSGRESALA